MSVQSFQQPGQLAPSGLEALAFNRSSSQFGIRPRQLIGQLACAFEGSLPARQNFLCELGKDPFAELAQLQSSLGPSFQSTDLDKLGAQCSLTARRLAALFTCLPPQFLGAEFGREIAAWTWRYADSEERESVNFEIELKRLDLDPYGLNVALNCISSITQGSFDTGALVANHDFIRQHAQSFQLERPLESILKQALRDPGTAELAHLEKFGIQPFCAADREAYAEGWKSKVLDTSHGPRSFSIFLDLPSAICLTYEGEPCAIVSITLFNQTTLFIRQLQGINSVSAKDSADKPKKFPSRGVSCFDLPLLGVLLAADYARTLGLNMLMIQSAENNRWTREQLFQGGPMHISIERAERIYDQTAQKLGFSSHSSGNWIIQLGKLPGV